MSFRRYTGPVRPSHRVPIVKYPPLTHVRITGTPSQCVCLWMHWLGSHAYPCQGDACPHCEHDAFPFGYAPCELGYLGTERWVPQGIAILPVTASALAICMEDHSGCIVSMTRFPLNKRGQTRFSVQTVKDAPPAVSFDILPHLNSTWNYFATKDAAKVAANGEVTFTRDQLFDVLRGIGKGA